MSSSLLPYRMGVGIALFNRDGHVFVGRRIDTTAEAWQMPQGGIDADEDPRTAAIRELAEETGITQAVVLGESPGWLDYDLPPDLIGKVWKGRYRGQRQKWFAMRFTGQDSDIRLDAHEPEFAEWRWVPFAQVPDLIVPFKRALYQSVVDALRPYAVADGAKST